MMLLAFLLTLQTGCARSISYVKPELPDPPAAIRACVALDVPAIPGEPGTPLSREQSAGALAEQRGAAFAFRRCADGWSAWYFDLKDGLMK